MPWLVKDKPTLEEKLFFVHVPRCGGTSLMHHFDVPIKVREGRSCWGRFGMRLFFHRYKLLETANFPIFTYGNGMALVLLAASLFFSATQFGTHIRLWGISVFLAIASFTFFFFLSFVFTAPTIGRIVMVRRAYLVLVHWVLCRFMESIDWCTGTNRTGYMMHLTAAKLLGYGYISAEEMEKVCSMAIVRNPYSRMVSMYNYNRFGRCESFPHFVKSWYHGSHKAYRESGEMDEWYTPCHAIPQFEYTHYQGRQLVQSIVKQEELKFLKTKEETPKAIAEDSTVADLPDPVRDALLGMPHTNARKTTKKWFEYYDQETLDLTYEMYQHDFVVFNYSSTLTQRTDLQPPALHLKEQQQQQQEQSARDTEAAPPIPPRPQLETMLRNSSRSSQERKSIRSNLLRNSSSQATAPGRPFHSSMVGPNSELILLEEDSKALMAEQSERNATTQNPTKDDTDNNTQKEAPAPDTNTTTTTTATTTTTTTTATTQAIITADGMEVEVTKDDVPVVEHNDDEDDVMPPPAQLSRQATPAAKDLDPLTKKSSAEAFGGLSIEEEEEEEETESEP